MAKSFKDNPAMAFISQESIAKAENTNEARTKQGEQPQIPLTSRPYTTPGAESKSQRVQLLIQPSLYQALKRRASEEGLSVNEAVSQAIRSYLTERK